MRKSTIAILLLAIALIATNGWWFYNSIDTGISLAHQGDTLTDNHQALVQVLAILPIVARPEATKRQVVAAASTATSYKVEPFEKDGFLWVDKIGLRFDNNGRLVEVAPSWSPF